MKVELIKTLYKQMIIGIIQTPPAHQNSPSVITRVIR